MASAHTETHKHSPPIILHVFRLHLFRVEMRKWAGLCHLPSDWIHSLYMIGQTEIWHINRADVPYSSVHNNTPIYFGPIQNKQKKKVSYYVRGSEVLLLSTLKKSLSIHLILNYKSFVLSYYWTLHFYTKAGSRTLSSHISRIFWK